MTIESDPDLLYLPEDDFRRTRAMLAPHVFALGGDSQDPPPSDLVDKEVWGHLVHLTDDVLLRTTSCQGTTTRMIHEICGQWQEAIPVHPKGMPYALWSPFLASEEFEAVAFIAAHGFYRQALSNLRVTLELMTHAAAYAATDDENSYIAWLSGNVEPRFRKSRLAIAKSDVGREIEERATPRKIWGDPEQNGWISLLYSRLCGYAHSQTGSTNGDFWKSNGPVYADDVYELVFDEMRETIAACYLLLKICWREFTLPTDLTLLLDRSAINDWPKVARAAFAAAFE
jgi:hypothetical protein